MFDLQTLTLTLYLYQMTLRYGRPFRNVLTIQKSRELMNMKQQLSQIWCNTDQNIIYTAFDQ